MKSRSFSLLAASLAIVAGTTTALTGCTDDGRIAEAPMDEAGEEIAGFEPIPLGTFRSQEVHIGEPTLLVLKDDGTFHSGIAAACIVPASSCTPQRDGLYHITQRTPDAAGLYLYNADGDPIDQYQFSLTGDTLRLRRLSTGAWRVMERSTSAWCSESSDCEKQDLGTAQCDGQWACSTNQCRFSCNSKD